MNPKVLREIGWIVGLVLVVLGTLTASGALSGRVLAWVGIVTGVLLGVQRYLAAGAGGAPLPESKPVTQPPAPAPK